MSKFEIREIEGKYYLYCASEDIDVEWTFDTIKKMIMTLVTYYTLEKV